MVDSAKIMTSGIGSPLDCTFYEKSTDVIDRIKTSSERFDMVICAYTLTELASDPARLVATQFLFDTLEINGVMIVVEQGNCVGSHAVRTARKVLLDKFDNKSSSADETEGILSFLPPPSGRTTDVEVSIYMKNLPNTTNLSIVLPGIHANDIYASLVAPCTHDRPCPLSPGLFCSFSQKVHGAMIRKASLEKFSYAVIQKRARQRPSSSAWTEFSVSRSSENATGTESTSLEIINQLLDTDREKRNSAVGELVDKFDWKYYVPIARRNEWGRVLRSPLKRKKHIIVDFCSSVGAIKRSVISRKSFRYIEPFYTAVKKTTWGGLHPVIASFDASKKLGVEGMDHLFSMRGPRKKKAVMIRNKLRSDIIASKVRKVDM